MSPTTQHPEEDQFWDADELTAPLEAADPADHDGLAGALDVVVHKAGGSSPLEHIITGYPPIFDSLFSQLPTSSVLDLFHTSRRLRNFLSIYPLAWKTLSFRLPQPAVVLGSPGNETPDGRERQSKQYALDGLLIQVVVPFGLRLTNLDLCNTAVSGVALVSRVLQPRINTIEHLSVRGCKNVSIKYHLVPFLEPYSQGIPWVNRKDLALKSLYAYRCRHHRRRPYLPSSLVRRDSDSEPTHQLIEICYELGIWTDTAWCPTPAGRCFRRKDYHNGRAPPNNLEVWVPFDRLWRSGNRIGTTNGSVPNKSDGRLWEDVDFGHDGEPLGPRGGPNEGKDVPVHLRRSHTTFVENIKCTDCGDAIQERCEQCSVRMHCMGCRKTLCASCAFNRPLPRKRQKTRQPASLAYGSNIPSATVSGVVSLSPAADLLANRPRSGSLAERFWWAPGATRSPNLMQETANEDEDSDSDEDGPVDPNTGALLSASPLKLNMYWCCLEPIFSGGGGIAFLGPGLSGRGADRIRAAPLPRCEQFEDADFCTSTKSPEVLQQLKHNALHQHILGDDVDILPYLQQDSLDLQATTCPRSLCQECYRTFRWKVSCRGCKKPLCKEHDFRSLKVRRCGYRDLLTEREFLRSYKEERTELEIPAFRRTVSQQQPSTVSQDSAIDSAPLSPSSSNHTDIPPPQPPQHVDIASPSTRPAVFQANYAVYDFSDVPSLASRPRSLSVSSLRPRTSVWPAATPKTLPRIPLPGHPRHPVQWEGCGAYFCQYPRAIGDNRSRCPALVRECKSCRVNVCNVSFTSVRILNLS